jgi:hypothetical protein
MRPKGSSGAEREREGLRWDGGAGRGGQGDTEGLDWPRLHRLGRFPGGAERNLDDGAPKGELRAPPGRHEEGRARHAAYEGTQEHRGLSEIEDTVLGHWAAAVQAVARVFGRWPVHQTLIDGGLHRGFRRKSHHRSAKLHQVQHFLYSGESLLDHSEGNGTEVARHGDAAPGFFRAHQSSAILPLREKRRDSLHPRCRGTWIGLNLEERDRIRDPASTQLNK